jgi:hypothetical protein
MSTRSKLLALVALLVGVVVAVPQLATGSKEPSATEARAKTVRIKEKVRLAPVKTSADYPAVGSRALYAGVIDLSTGRHGAKRLRATITATPSPTSWRFHATETNYLAKGSFRVRLTGTTALAPDGSQTFEGVGAVTGGTGRFEGARGKVSFRGTAPQPGGVITGTGKGTLRY